MRRWVRVTVLAAGVGVGFGVLSIPGSLGAEVAQPIEAAQPAQPIEVAPEALGPNVLGNAGFEAPAISGGFRTIEPGTTLGTCRTIPGVTVKAGCWVSAFGFGGVDVVRTLWPAHQGKQSLDLNATFGAGGVMQAAPVAPGAHVIQWYSRRSPSAPAGETGFRLNVSVTFFSSAGNVLAADRFTHTKDNDGGFTDAGWIIQAPTGTVAAVVLVNSDRSSGPFGVVIDSVRLSRY